MSSMNIYNVLRSSVITEKATRASEDNTYVFVVDKKSSKKDVKHAVSTLFDVNVLSVNTSILKGKKKRFRGKIGQRSNVKRAFVRIEDGQEIDLSVTV